MTDAHPTRDEVLGAFGDAFCLLVRHLDEHADGRGPVMWAQAYEQRITGEVRDVMEIHT
jgi:hypothetical protein